MIFFQYIQECKKAKKLCNFARFLQFVLVLCQQKFTVIQSFTQFLDERQTEPNIQAKQAPNSPDNLKLCTIKPSKYNLRKP